MNAARSHRLDALLPGHFAGADGQLAVTGLCADSRQVRPGDLFFALRGARQSGGDFVEDALRAGAVAVASDVPAVAGLRLPVPVCVEAGLARRLSAIAGQFYDHPSHALEVTAITGTNGKTSCCYWLAWLLAELGVAVGQIGTLGAAVRGVAGADEKGRAGETPLAETGGLTTPPPLLLQKLLAECRAAGASAVVLEASSHGLEQGRLAAVRVACALFTNLSQDHLDYHPDLRAYLRAKRRLFEMPGLRRAIVNLDDPASAEILAAVAPGVEQIGYSLSNAKAAMRLTRIEENAAGYRGRLESSWGTADLALPVFGRYNLSNLLAVAAVALAAGHDFAAVTELLERVPPVPGRLECLTAAGAPRVVVDFAHTSQAVSLVLQALRERTAGRLFAVLGCGGNRDAAKRPLMAQAAVAHSDRQIFTADNPRDESVGAILAQMTAGLSPAERETLLCVEDRAAAIAQAVRLAGPDDTVAVLGRGAETHQEVAGRRIPLDDRQLVRSALRGRGRSC
ncbi:MAG: UDP-N-acetylmuramoyl-L-alanyl-D-glutamate--2,6-diaminopimelate ligase [Cellvibrionales bacterium]|nr:UDP-N-acetylmuramoyl-L-alanyl-D-glutamate--2,6-diaminopimelate ligase [Cellvibrionales bacterium]